MTRSIEKLLSYPMLFIQQKSRHWYEILFSWEQKNEYRIESSSGVLLGQMVEQGKGFLNVLSRLFLKSHRPLNIEITEFSTNEVALRLQRSFFFLFSDMEVKTMDERNMGSVHRRFGILNKRYDLRDEHGDLFATIRSPLWRLWTFPIFDRSDSQVAVITKKWKGLVTEYMTDADNFLLDFGDEDWSLAQRCVILAAALSIDFDFFENNSGSGG